MVRRLLKKHAMHGENQINFTGALDDYNREGLSIEVDLSLSSKRVMRPWGLIEWRGTPPCSCWKEPGIQQGHLGGSGQEARHYTGLYPARQPTVECMYSALHPHLAL